jgi:transcriptional regulator with XRE-family HTH domain
MATQICVQFGKKVRELRKAKGWRQIDLAAHAKLSETYICELEKGKWEIGLVTLERLAEALGVKVSELMQAIGR